MISELEMIKIRSYARLVEAKRRTIDEVPEMYRQAVQEYLSQ